MDDFKSLHEYFYRMSDWLETRNVVMLLLVHFSTNCCLQLYVSNARTFFTLVLPVNFMQFNSSVRMKTRFLYKMHISETILENLPECNIKTIFFKVKHRKIFSVVTLWCIFQICVPRIRIFYRHFVFILTDSINTFPW